MQLKDLVIQGLGRFDQNQKILFQPGFNFIYGANESGKSTIVNIILELLFPDRYREKELNLISNSNPDNARADRWAAGLCQRHRE